MMRGIIIALAPAIAALILIALHGAMSPRR